MEPGLSSIAALGLHLATRTVPAGNGRAVRDHARLGEALARRALGVDDTVRIAGVTTTVGRHLVAACLPPSLRSLSEQPWGAAIAARTIARIVRELHVEIAGRCVDALEMLGRHVAERSGLSIALDDLKPPPAVRAVIAAAHAEWVHWEQEYADCLITDGERFNRQFEVWSQATQEAQLCARRDAPARDPLVACAASQRAPVSAEALRSPRGLIALAFGERWALHLTGTLAEGLGAHEYFVRSAAARHDTLAVAERQQLARALFADLDAAIGDVEIVTNDCGTTRGVRMRAIVYENDELGSLAAKLAGAVTAEAVLDRDGAMIAAAGTVLVPALARRIEDARIASVVLRDVRTCEAAGGVCARCFGLAPEDALWTCVGDPVGARAATAIASQASELPARRIYHVC